MIIWILLRRKARYKDEEKYPECKVKDSWFFLSFFFNSKWQNILQKLTVEVFCLLTVYVNLHVLLKLFILCKFGKKIVIKEFCFERQKELIWRKLCGNCCVLKMFLICILLQCIYIIIIIYWGYIKSFPCHGNLKNKLKLDNYYSNYDSRALILKSRF